MQEYLLNVSAQEAGKRLDLFLMDFFKKQNIGLSRTFTQRLILEGKVKVKDGHMAKPAFPAAKRRYEIKKGVVKPHLKLKRGDEISVCLEDKKAIGLQAEDIPLDVIYEDEDLAIINKSPGLVVHPAPGNYEHTLVNALLHRFKELSDINPDRPGIVHRLDKETSGLLVIAKNNSAHLALSRQFAKHSIKRKYIALVKGKREFDENIIEVPIGRHPYKRKNMSVGFGERTKYAKTYYRTLKRTENLSLLELEPFTGRTHQLRVHLAFSGHPVLGDTKYGRDNAFARLALHAQSIGFMHPRTGKFVEFSCPAPVEFKEILRNK